MKAMGLLPKDWQPRKRSDGRTPKKENQPRRGPQACQTGAHPKRHRHLCGLWSSDDQQAFWIDLPTRSVAIHNLSARAHTAKWGHSGMSLTYRRKIQWVWQLWRGERV